MDKKFNNTFENFVLGQLKWVSDGGLSEDNHRQRIFPSREDLFVYSSVYLFLYLFICLSIIKSIPRREEYMSDLLLTLCDAAELAHHYHPPFLSSICYFLWPTFPYFSDSITIGQFFSWTICYILWPIFQYFFLIL